MKKIVSFVAFLMLSVCIFFCGVLYSKLKASKSLFEAIEQINTQSKAAFENDGIFNNQILHAVVSIKIHFKHNEEIKTKHGTGVISKLDKSNGNATIYTCEHLFIEDGFSLSDIEIFLYGLEFEQCKINAHYVGGSQGFDFALLYIEDSEILKCSNAKSANFENTYNMGQTVYAAGNAIGKGITVSKGIVSKDAEKTVSDATFHMLQTDAALNFGCSGGPLFSERGEVLGLICAKEATQGAQGIGYALPSAICKIIASKIETIGRVEMYDPDFSCSLTPYLDHKKATVSVRLTVAQSNDNRIVCGDVLLYAIMNEEIFTFSNLASFGSFLLLCESENAVLAFYRDGKVIEICPSEWKTAIV